MAPELELLDQLLGGDLSLAVLRPLFDTDERFRAAAAALLHAGDVRLVATGGADVPRWQWRDVLADQAGRCRYQLCLTAAGARRVA